MGDVTGISWTDSTFNPWIGCTKVGPGCDHCYAEALDKRHRWRDATHWGAGKPRMRTSAANWRKPMGWNEKAAEAGKTWRVFCASLADVFDNEVMPEWRSDLFDMIRATPHLTWQLLTKRVGNVMDMVPADWRSGFPANVWMGMTTVTQSELDRDIGKLRAIPAHVRWLSIEPQIEQIVLTPGELHWVVTGGESGPKARSYSLDWARSIVQQCRRFGIAPFVKQLGSRVGMKHRAGADPSEWPTDLRVQEFPC